MIETQIKKLLSKAQTRKAIELLSDHFTTNEVNELLNRYKQNENTYLQKRITYEIYNIELLEINRIIIQLVENQGKTPEIKKANQLTPIPFLTNKNQFIGRAKTLTEIHQKLQNTQPVLLVNGMGGIGKTAVAKAYITDYQNQYDHLAWLTVLDESENNIQNAFVNDMALIKNLDLLSALEQFKQDEQRTEKIFQLIINALHQKTGNNLLIIDNANDRNALLEQVTDLEKTGWKVLLTSRATAKVYQIISIDELPEAEAIELFYQHYHREKDDTLVQQILKDIDRHTLLTELIAKAGETARLSLADLTHHIKTEGIKAKKLQRKILTGKNNEKLQYPKEAKVFNYIQYIFKNITHLSDAEKTYLRYFSILPLQGHSEEFLVEIFQIEEENEEDFYDILNDLVKKGWLIEDNESYRLHPLIQEVVIEQLKPDIENCKTLIESINNLLYFDQYKDNPIEKFQFLIYGDSLLKYLHQENLTTAELYSKTAQVLMNMGDYQKAANYEEKALSIATKENNEPKIATYQNNLGWMLQYLGNFEKAIMLLENTLKFNLTTFGKNHPIVAVNQSNLGEAYRNLGQYDKASKFLKAALASDIMNFGKNHPTVAVCQSNLANVYWNLGLYEKAALLLETVLKSDVANFGENHPTVTISKNNLAEVYRSLGRYKEAITLFKSALKSDMANFGKNHPNVAICQNNLSEVYRSLGRYKEAITLLKFALKSDMANFGENHPNVGFRLNNLGLNYSYLNNLKKSKEYYQAALKVYSIFFGNNHPEVLKTKGNLEIVMQKLNNSKY